jgi:predicted ABC-type transport system involved in lysophospholipase L1 biosynthesis ATPase subunit
MPTATPAKTAEAVRLTHVSKTFLQGDSPVRVLDDVDLSIASGETVAIVGRSGSGKSTLLHLAAGLTDPDRGEVVVAGTKLAGASATARALLRRRRIGFVFQFFHLLPALTVLENVALPLVLDGRSDADVQAMTLLKRVGLQARASHRPAQLSGGEMQRVAVARALVIAPSLVLADEPTGSLDAANGADVLSLLRAGVDDAGASLLLVTHDAAVAAAADRVLTLVDGQLT